MMYKYTGTHRPESTFERGDRRCVEDEATKAVLVWRVARHELSREARHVERAQQVHADDFLEEFVRVNFVTLWVISAG